jgi:tryptophan 2,3-dioxygenase
VLERDLATPHRSHPSVLAAWAEIYRNTAAHWDLYQLAEELVDLEDWFQQWRFRHMTTVKRIIGFKRGTGGTAGVGYLRHALDTTFFPELWEVRTELS